MKRLYITGIAGLLGANMAYLLKDHYEITGADKILFKASGIKSECFDLLDYIKLKESIERCAPDYLVHTAALVDVDLCEEEKELAYRLNCGLTNVLAEICKNISCQMVYISTDAVFDGNSSRLYTERDITCPVNYYGKTKLLGEDTVLKNNYIVVRTNIYGFNVQDKNSFGEWVYKSLQKGEQLDMFGDIKFSSVLVNDLAVIIIKLLEEGRHGLYHVCSSGSVSKYSFGKCIQDVFSITGGKINKTESSSFNFKAKRAKDMGMSNEKVKKELNINIPGPEESIKEFYKLYHDGYGKELKEWGGCS